ncbi:MAG: murein hydrolase activator EnvC family protein [Patescibacteria group bacterium]
MKKLLFIFLPFLIFTLLYFGGEFVVHAHPEGFLSHIGGTESEDAPVKDESTKAAEEAQKEYEEKVEELEEKIEEYEDKIDNLHNEASSLSKEIELTDSQIGLTTLRIQSTQTEINQKEHAITNLAEDIDELKLRIEKLKDNMDYQQVVLSERLRARYKVVDNSFVLVLFGSDDLSSAIQKSEYLKIMSRYDQKLLDQMRETKEAFGLQRDIFEEKKQQEESLKAQIEQQKQELEVYKVQLDRQKEDKEDLLEETQNDEQKYQQLLAQVQSELAALQLAIDLPEGEGEKVKEGDIIGLMGNTGCSSDAHLHFGYVKNGTARDPLSQLDSGNIAWPVDNPRITQGFGANYTFYMNNFGIPGHDALDLVSGQCYGSACAGAPIRAAKDGELYYAKDAKVYCPRLNNSIGKGAIIDHGDGERTIYWHLQ